MEGSATSGPIHAFVFDIGQVVRHRDKGFRGVIVDAHPHFQGPVDAGSVTDALRKRWHQPWYELLIHGTPHVLYLPEDAVEADTSCLPVSHPLLQLFFNDFRHGRYGLQGPVN